MIIFKRPDPPDDYLQEAGPSGWSFASGRILRMIICNELKIILAVLTLAAFGRSEIKKQLGGVDGEPHGQGPARSGSAVPSSEQ